MERMHIGQAQQVRRGDGFVTAVVLIESESQVAGMAELSMRITVRRPPASRESLREIVLRYVDPA